MIDAKSVFSIAADGSDETAKVAAAFAAGTHPDTEDEIYFGPGIYGVSGLPPIAKQANFRGMRNRTFFKNLSSTVRLFEFQKQASGDLKTSYIKAGGFTILQEGCTASAITAGAQLTQLHDIAVQGQGGDAFAIDLDGTTLADVRNILVTGSNNGIRAKTVYYLRGDHWGVERLNGIGVLLDGVGEAVIDALYVDNKEASSSKEALKIFESFSVHINGLSCEFHHVAPLSVPGYIGIFNSENVNICGGRVNHTVPQSKYVFNLEGSAVSIRDFEWVETQNAMIFCGVAPSNRIASFERIRTNISATGSKYGVTCWAGKSGRITLSDWMDRAGQPIHILRADDVLTSQVSSPIQVVTDSGMRSHVNCPSVTTVPIPPL